MDDIENQIFDEIPIGATASLTRTLSWDDIRLFAVMSGDVNPAHVDQEFAKSAFFHTIVAHGMWGGALISTLLGTRLPGPGAVYVSQSLHFRAPVKLGDTVKVEVTVAELNAERRRARLDCICSVDGTVVLDGEALVKVPSKEP